jgi:ABC-type transport system involved in multi-copper enzyme maturation permease subunit
MAILTIARLTLREASRRKLLISVAILTLLVAILSDWGFHRLLQLPCGSDNGPQPCSASELKLLASTLLIMLMFMFSFVLALGAAFIAAPAIASDIESGVLLSMLPRPIRRSDIVIGKWLGLCTLLAIYSAIACGMEFILANYAMNYVPPHPITAIVFVIVEGIVVLTLTLLGSTRLPAMTGGIIVLVLFGVTWMAGIVGGVGAAFHSKPIQNVGTISSLILPTDGLWRAAIYNLEPVAVLAVGKAAREASGNPFFVPSGPTAAYMIWSLAWIAGMLGLAMWSFRRREL